MNAQDRELIERNHRQQARILNRGNHDLRIVCVVRAVARDAARGNQTGETMSKTRKLAIVKATKPETREEKREAAISFLGDRWCLAKDYKPRVRVGSALTAWMMERHRGRA